MTLRIQKSFFKIVFIFSFFLISAQDNPYTQVRQIVNFPDEIVFTGDNDAQAGPNGNCFGGGCVDNDGKLSNEHYDIDIVDLMDVYGPSDFGDHDDSGSNDSNNSGDQNSSRNDRFSNIDGLGHSRDWIEKNWNNLKKDEQDRIKEALIIKQTNERLIENTQASLKLSNEVFNLTQALDYEKIQLSGIELSQDEQVLENIYVNQNSEMNYLNYNLKSDFIKNSQYIFKSDQKNEFSDIRQKLLKAQIKTPQQAQAQMIGLDSLKKSDEALLSNQQELGQFYKDVAIKMVDIVTDFLPVISESKDLFRAFAGIDPVTGHQLNNVDRMIAGGFAALGIVTLGGAKYAKFAIQEVKNITKASVSEAKLAENIVEAVKNTPGLLKTGQSPRIAVKGESDVITVIGRDMETVQNTDRFLKAEGLKTDVFKESKSASVEFIILKNKFAKNNSIIPDRDLFKTETFKENKIWINEALKNNHTILDLGKPEGTTESLFYNMELKEIENFLNQKGHVN